MGRELDVVTLTGEEYDALKLARSALMHDGYPCGNGCKCRACEALAAIEALVEKLEQQLATPVLNKIKGNK